MRSVTLTKLAALTSIVLCLMCMGFTRRWGPDGHKVVAQIASDNLTDKTKQAVEKLLDGDTLPGVAVWADAMRATNPAYAHTAPWHFADMNPGQHEFVLDRDCPDKGCVVQAILDASSTLAAADGTKGQRQEALKFLVHFVGDVHQPLHVGHKSDLGGNEIHVKLFGASLKLHAVWDSGLIKHKGKAWPAYAQSLETAIKPQDKSSWLSVTDPAQWATESFKLAEEHAYRTSTGEEINDGDVLQAEYYQDNITIVDEQLTKAGLRLANVLNTIFDPPTQPSQPTHPTANPGNTPGAVAPNVKFVGSRRSQVYHLPGCKDVERIDPDNLVEYTEAPPGKRLHQGCPHD